MDIQNHAGLFSAGASPVSFGGWRRFFLQLEQLKRKKEREHASGKFARSVEKSLSPKLAEAIETDSMPRKGFAKFSGTY